MHDEVFPNFINQIKYLNEGLTDEGLELSFSNLMETTKELLHSTLSCKWASETGDKVWMKQTLASCTQWKNINTDKLTNAGTSFMYHILQLCSNILLWWCSEDPDPSPGGHLSKSWTEKAWSDLHLVKFPSKLSTNLIKFSSEWAKHHPLLLWLYQDTQLVALILQLCD